MKNWIKWIIVGFCLLFMVAIKWFWRSYPDDNAVEECAELVIEKNFDINIDLTPFSIEETKKLSA